MNTGGTAGSGGGAAGTPDEAGETRPRGDGIVVRAARAGDAPALAALSTELGYPCDTVQIEPRLSALLASDRDAVFVVEAEGSEVVGFIHGAEKQLLVSERYVELGGLIVASAARRRGAARLLIAAVEHWARERGVGLLRVRTRLERDVAHVSYRRCGFELEKEQRVFVKWLALPGRPPRLPEN